MTALSVDNLPVPEITPAHVRRAGIWCAAQARQHPGLDPADTTLDLLYEVGVIPDPLALIRIAGHSRVAANQSRGEP